VIYLLLGENSFLQRQHVAQLTTGCDETTYDGADIAISDLVDIFMGQSLFSTTRAVVIRDGSHNKVVWGSIVDWLERNSAEPTIILIETKLDKRTKAYATLQKRATVIHCTMWSDRQTMIAEKWVADFARDRGVALSPALVRQMVQRAVRSADNAQELVIDQQLLATVIEQLADTDTEITAELLDSVMAPSTQDNVFMVFERALHRDVAAVQQTIRNLAQKDDGYKLLGLLAVQTSNLAALVLGGSRASSVIASDIGVHPFTLRTLEKSVGALSHGELRSIVAAVHTADIRAKSGTDVWTALEHALMQIAFR